MSEANFVICADSIRLNELNVIFNTSIPNAAQLPWLIMHTSEHEAILKPSRIDQQIYFYDVTRDRLYEYYSINGVTVKRGEASSGQESFDNCTVCL
jgi:hypothetical protein